MDTAHSILKFAKRFFVGTLFSRISGAIRDMSMAFCFGAAPEIASFMVAYRLANLFRRLFGEGNLQGGFIPHYERGLGKEKLLFYRDTSFSLLVFVLLFVLCLEGALFFLVPFLSPAWKEIVILSAWMAPGLIFICLYGLNAAFLQAEKSFFTPAIAPILFNFSWIFAAFYARLFPLQVGVKILSLGIVFAFFLQWSLTALKVRRKISEEVSWKEWFSPKIFSSSWKELIKPLSLGVLGIAAVQFNSAFDAIFAKVADSRGPAFLWYAIRLQQFPLALFGIALSGALLPPLSRAMKEENLEKFKLLLHSALKYGTALMVPCTFALFALSFSGINLLFGRGDFSTGDVLKTSLCLFGYAVGLLPSVFVLLFSSGFYAKKIYKIPSFAAAGSVGVNLLLNTVFVFFLKWGTLSVALATSFASIFNAVILFIFLKEKIMQVFPKEYFSFLCRLFVSSFMALVVSWGCQYFFLQGEPFPRNFFSQISLFSLSSLSFLLSFCVSAKPLGLLGIFLDLLKRKPSLDFS